MRKKVVHHRRKAAPRHKASPAPTEPVALSIQGMSHEGRGVAHHNGKTIFVTGALPGEDVQAQIEKQHRRYDEARCLEVIQPSEYRTTPVCKHYEQCGGCDLQHLDASQQIVEKQRIVLDQLARLGKVSPEHIDPPLTSDTEQYRRSARLGINQRQRDDEVLVGFRRRGSNKILSVDECPVLEPRLNQVIPMLHKHLGDAGNIRDITHAEITLGDTDGSITLRVKKKPQDNLLNGLNTEAAKLNLKLYLNTGDQVTAVDSPADLHYALSDHQLKLRFLPGDFLQVNRHLNTAMINRALEWLTPTTDDRILDLFSGIGNFTLPLARYAGHVVGVEGIDTMVNRATANATANQLNNCEFYRANLSDDLRHHSWYRQGFNKILLDPPRTGALEAIKQLSHYDASQILYVSCNPAALARDAAALVEQGYQFTRFCVMDMFPHTSHVESLALFEKRAN